MLGYHATTGIATTANNPERELTTGFCPVFFFGL
jgi:hypothetical protein